MTPRYFAAMADGKRRQVQDLYEVERYGAFLVISARMQKGRQLSLKDMPRFSWEKEERKAAPFDTVEFSERLARMEAAEKRLAEKIAQKRQDGNSRP